MRQSLGVLSCIHHCWTHHNILEMRRRMKLPHRKWKVFVIHTLLEEGIGQLRKGGRSLRAETSFFETTR
jgi:hypothetical protein